jgi:hypothetical protein
LGTGEVVEWGEQGTGEMVEWGEQLNELGTGEVVEEVGLEGVVELMQEPMAEQEERLSKVVPKPRVDC